MRSAVQQTIAADTVGEKTVKKQLRLEIRQNLHRPPRVYVRSVDLQTLYGSFHVNEPESFEGWEALSTSQTIELKQFMQNATAVYQYLNPAPANALADFRFRLPYDFIELLEKIELLCHQEQVDLNIFDTMITGIIQQIKVAVSQLSGESKTQALELLDRANLAEYKKQDYSNQIKAIFAELQAIPNRSEKLHQKAKDLFNKDKSYSPLAIKGMSEGQTVPSKWLVACAIDLLLDEHQNVIETMLSGDDLFMLWVKPLLTQGYGQDFLKDKITGLKHQPEMEAKLLKSSKNLS